MGFHNKIPEDLRRKMFSNSEDLKGCSDTAKKILCLIKNQQTMDVFELIGINTDDIDCYGK